MKKNLYFRKVIKRKNKVNDFIFDFFSAIASYPRILLEVFLRKQFGERYFKISSAVTAAIFTALFPFIFEFVATFFSGRRYYGGSNSDSLSTDFTPYAIFILLFLVFTCIRSIEIERRPSSFNFGYFSYSMGQLNPLFYKIKIFGKAPSPRFIETFYEPLVFFLLGVLFYLFGSSFGVFLIVCSICYSISYMAAYAVGDDFVLDHIDEMLMNQEVESSFVNDEDISKTKGVRFYANKPDSKELRRKLGNSFIEDEKEDVAEAV